MTGPLEKNCTCRPGFFGDGETCKGALHRLMDIVKWTHSENTKILRYHKVACRALLPEDLMHPRNLTTLPSDILTITYFEDTDA
ncbi:uncharacterized protein [Garra rufa]|uniref:uncharacterized protein n=1 Tax=Garra rufa TaxID=137080 RepID=UPI003CCE855E